MKHKRPAMQQSGHPAHNMPEPEFDGTMPPMPPGLSPGSTPMSNAESNGQMNAGM